MAYAAAKEVPEFISSISASTGGALSLSRLRKTATLASPGAPKMPLKSSATEVMSGAMRSDAPVAGPREAQGTGTSSSLNVPE